MFGVAVDDALVHCPGDVDLMRHQLHGYLGVAPQELGLDRVRTIELQDSRLERLLRGRSLIDRRRKLLEDLVAQQRPQPCLIATGP